ncbi:MAG: PilZ domain-containing protein [Desulfobacterales bacterium]|nr:MAG: PilZ domain-containing protein [Desulfobacterales bacterium]
MAEKVFIANNDTVKLVCPKCGKSKAEKISEYLNMHEAVRLKHQCGCGYLHTALLERRKRYRKTVNLSGEYDYSLATGQSAKGAITVKDISRAGLGFQMDKDERQDFVIGDQLVLKFHLDDEQKTLIRKEVIIRNIRGLDVGVEFSSVDLYDRALGLYMFT